jgi:exopolysaccharide biosynthesis polyprenyl glycosylphosphotransferase
MNTFRQRIRYSSLDYIAALLSWVAFYAFRRLYIEEALQKHVKIFITGETRFWLALMLLPLIWVLFYKILGHYENVYRRSRLTEVWHTFLASLIGNIFVFFFLILDDVVNSHKDYYLSFSVLFSLHFMLTWLFRLLLTSITKNRINKGKIGFRTIIIGNVTDFKKISNKIVNVKAGHKLLGCVSVSETLSEADSGQELPYLGSLDQLQEIIDTYRADEVIIVSEEMSHQAVDKLLEHLRFKNVLIKTVPALSPLLAGKVRISFFMGAPLAVVEIDLMKPWQQSFKRIFDLCFSLTALILLLPFFPFIMAGIKLSSAGPVFYKQKRVGKHGKSFWIYKFRSMYTDAEKDGPQLSSGNDPRITGFGKFMRKYRVDEIPQFFNVLKGDMSVVGPRPERRYFVERIMERAPEYSMLLAVKPGITSWGAIKYGYTENIEQMLEQLKYDIYYVQNRSLLLDFKILFGTVLVVLGKKGM